MTKQPHSGRKYVRLDASSWSEVDALWEAGDMTLQDLEARFGVSRRALQSHFSKHKVTKGAKAAEMAAVVKDKVFSEILPEADVTVSRAKATREAAYRNAVVVEELIMSQLSAAQKDPAQALKAASALKALSLAAAGLERIHQLKWRALGLDKNAVEADELPVLVFQDLNEQELLAMKSGDEDIESDWDLPEVTYEDQGSEIISDDLQRDGEADAAPVETRTLNTRSESLSDGTRLVRNAV